MALTFDMYEVVRKLRGKGHDEDQAEGVVEFVREATGGFDYGPVDPPPGRYTALRSSLYRARALTEAGEVLCWGDAAYEEPPIVWLE